MAAIKRYTVSEIENQPTNQALWALNGSANVNSQPGDIVIGVPKLNGARADTLFLPSTWLPINLTDQMSRAQMLASSEFRKAVNSGLVELISEEDAKRMLNDDGATEEKERLNEQARRVKETMAGRGVHHDDVALTSDRDGNAEATDPNELDPGFVIFFDSVATRPDIEALNAIRTRARFQRRELQHMLNTLVDKPKCQEFLRRNLGR